LPLAAFLALVLCGRALPRRAIAVLGTAPAAAAAALAVAIAWNFIASPPPGGAFVSPHWTWIDVGDHTLASGHILAQVGLYLDPLAVVMMLVVTVIGFLILLYSMQYMAGDESYGRFFAYMNLFVSMMLVLVLADNLLFFYLGWEGVGLCSYLLISFWYKDAANVRAGRKAFIVTRVGDTALLLGIFLLATNLGTLDIQGVLAGAANAQTWPAGSGLAVAAAMLLLGGALGKSAQLPLQTWLPDAMAGPTPTSALIHAATMVTAGVYLLARMSPLMAKAPDVQTLTAVIGAATLLYAGLSALVQRDIKRVLAYSTISQVGYMFLALGVGSAWSAIFHLVTHAVFKSLLFLAAGAVILAMRHEQDMFKMGGLRKRMPLAFWSFLIGGAALSALPLVTSGDYSKDAMLEAAWMLGTPGGKIFWTAGAVGAIISAAYTFRMIFLVFFGKERRGEGVSPARGEGILPSCAADILSASDAFPVAQKKKQQQQDAGGTPATHAGETPAPQPGAAMKIPLVVLSVLTIALAPIQWPRSLGDMPLLSNFLEGTFHVHPNFASSATDSMLLGLTGVASLLGLTAAYVMFLRRPELSLGLATSPMGSRLRRLWLAGWGFDWLYDRLLVGPFVATAKFLRGDFVDWIYRAVAGTMTLAHFILSATVTGRLRWYAAGIVIGAIVFLFIVVLR
jgi:NADH-quinone oxidoreductase subunit L